jgi:Heterokaryon incompatibility protein (HET)
MSHRNRGFPCYKRADEASRNGISYLWLDTCCIDKSSSAELSEAINSTYKWYADSEVCCAYLDDVPSINHLEVEHFVLTWVAVTKPMILCMHPDFDNERGFEEDGCTS